MQYRVVVATVRGRYYYKITSALKSMGLKYYSMSPEEASASDAKVIITTREEAGLIAGRRNLMLDTDLEQYPAIAKAKILRNIIGGQADDQLVIGIDPGNRIGVSVIYLHEEIASVVELSPEDAVEEISVLLGGIKSRRKVVKIGDGKIMMANQMAWALKMKFHDGVEVELVNEHGTSRPQDTEVNRRGARDRSSARTIALRAGRTFEMK